VTYISSRGPSSAAAVDAAPAHRLIDLPEVLRRVPLCRARIYQLIRAGELPQQIKLGSRSCWLEREIDAWIGALVATRHDHEH
jgi:predicted DNA-binding transcriptional regulator AlpA